MTRFIAYCALASSADANREQTVSPGLQHQAADHRRHQDPAWRLTRRHLASLCILRPGRDTHTHNLAPGGIPFTLFPFFPLQRMCHDWLMQRRAQQDARTPHKMRRSASLVADSSLSLEEKKRKILRCLRRLETLGVLRPSQTHTQILTMIAKVTTKHPPITHDHYQHSHHHHHLHHLVLSHDPAVQSHLPSEPLQDIRQQRLRRQRRGAELQRLSHTLRSLQEKSAFHSEQVDFYRDYITSCLDNLTASR